MNILAVLGRSAVHLLFKAFIIITAIAETYLLCNFCDAAIGGGQQLDALRDTKTDQIEKGRSMLVPFEYAAAFPL